MALQRDILAAGNSSESAKAIVGHVLKDLTATGTTQTDAYEILRPISVFTTVAAGAGARLLSSANKGDQIAIANKGANNLLVYPAEGGSIDGGAIDAPYTVPVGKSTIFWCITADVWVILQGDGGAGLSGPAKQILFFGEDTLPTSSADLKWFDVEKHMLVGGHIWPEVDNTWNLGLAPIYTLDDQIPGLQWANLFVYTSVNFGPDVVGFADAPGEIIWNTGTVAVGMSLALDRNSVLARPTALALNGPHSSMANINSTGLIAYHDSTDETKFNGIYLGMGDAPNGLIQVLWDGTNATQPQNLTLDAQKTTQGVVFGSVDGLGGVSGWSAGPLDTPVANIGAVFPSADQLGDLGTPTKQIRDINFGGNLNVQGNPGVSFSGAITNLTCINGVVTAAS